MTGTSPNAVADGVVPIVTSVGFGEGRGVEINETLTGYLAGMTRQL